MLDRLVYKNRASYETVEQLNHAIFKCCHGIDLSFILNIFVFNSKMLHCRYPLICF